jgi:hypothetical protein
MAALTLGCGSGDDSAAPILVPEAGHEASTSSSTSDGGGGAKSDGGSSDGPATGNAG